MKRLFAVLIAASACTLTAAPSFADAGSIGLKVRKICDAAGHTGAKLTSCCEKQTSKSKNFALDSASCIRGEEIKAGSQKPKAKEPSWCSAVPGGVTKY